MCSSGWPSAPDPLLLRPVIPDTSQSFAKFWQVFISDVLVSIISSRQTQVSIIQKKSENISGYLSKPERLRNVCLYWRVGLKLWIMCLTVLSQDPRDFKKQKDPF